MFKIKDGYKLELQTPQTMKLFGSTKKSIDETKNGENVLNWLNITCNLVDNQYQQNFEVLCSFTPNKSYVYLLNAEPSKLVFLKTYNAEFLLYCLNDDNAVSLVFVFTKSKSSLDKISKLRKSL